MGKADYKKVSDGPEYAIKRDLDVSQFLSMHRRTKKWMKRSLARYTRRKMRAGESA